jgi:hypothetical protein
MKEQKFIIDEVKKHLQASARKNKYQVIDAAQEMPTFEGVYTPLLRLYNGRNEIPGKRRGNVYLL